MGPQVRDLFQSIYSYGMKNVCTPTQLEGDIYMFHVWNYGIFGKNQLGFQLISICNAKNVTLCSRSSTCKIVARISW